MKVAISRCPFCGNVSENSICQFCDEPGDLIGYVADEHTSETPMALSYVDEHPSRKPDLLGEEPDDYIYVTAGCGLHSPVKVSNREAKGDVTVRLDKGLFSFSIGD